MTDTVAASAAKPSAAEPPWPSAGRAYYTVFIMALVVMFAEIDRGIISLLAQAIKKDFALSDTQLGLLMGLAFALFYAICGLPLSRFIDRNNRKNILAAALALWSVATAFCGLAQNFVQLFLARVFLGAGESVNGPAIFSIITDSFPKERLPRAIAMMQVGVLGGNAFALIMGAVVIHYLVAMPPQEFLGLTIRWWQMVFIIVGLPGLLIALIQFLTIKEPARRGVQNAAETAKIGFFQVLKYAASHGKVYGPMLGSMAITALAMGAISWGPAFYERTYGWNPAKIGMTMGILSLIATPIGLATGVVVVEWLQKRGVVDAPYKVVVFGRLLVLPFSILMPLMPTPELALAAWTMAQIGVGATGSSTNAVLQIVTPNQMRGQMTAILLFLYSVVGNGLSPVLLGLITDYAFRDPNDLRYAILAVNALFMPLSLVVFSLGLKPYRRELTRLGLAP